MKSVSIHRPSDIPRSLQATLREAQMEAGCLGSTSSACTARRVRTGRHGQPATRSRSTPRDGQAALPDRADDLPPARANVEATTERRRNEPSSRRWLRYPYKEKRFFALSWPAQAVDYDRAAKRLGLPMGWGRKSLVFKLALDFEPGGVKLVWNEGYASHIVRSDIEKAKDLPGDKRATVDLGEIHQAAVAVVGARTRACGRGVPRGYRSCLRPPFQKRSFSRKRKPDRRRAVRRSPKQPEKAGSPFPSGDGSVTVFPMQKWHCYPSAA